MNSLKEDYERLIGHSNVSMPDFLKEMNTLYFDKFIYERNLTSNNGMYDISVRIDSNDFCPVADYCSRKRSEVLNWYSQWLRTISNEYMHAFLDVYFEFDSEDFFRNPPSLLVTTEHSVRYMHDVSDRQWNEKAIKGSQTLVKENEASRRDAFRLFSSKMHVFPKEIADLVGYLDEQSVLYQLGLMPRKEMIWKLYYRFLPISSLSRCFDMGLGRRLKEIWHRFESVISPNFLPEYVVLDLGAGLDGMSTYPKIGISFYIEDIVPFLEHLRKCQFGDFNVAYWENVLARWKDSKALSKHMGMLLQRRSISHVKASLSSSGIDWKIYLDNTLYSSAIRRSNSLLH